MYQTRPGNAQRFISIYIVSTLLSTRQFVFWPDLPLSDWLLSGLDGLFVNDLCTFRWHTSWCLDMVT